MCCGAMRVPLRPPMTCLSAEAEVSMALELLKADELLESCTFWLFALNPDMPFSSALLLLFVS